MNILNHFLDLPSKGLTQKAAKTGMAQNVKNIKVTTAKIDVDLNHLPMGILVHPISTSESRGQF